MYTKQALRELGMTGDVLSAGQLRARPIEDLQHEGDVAGLSR